MFKRDVLVIGGGIAGVQASLDIADKGFKVVLVDKESSIGGKMVKLDKTFPTNDCSICISAPKMVEVSRHKNIDLLTYSEVKQVEGGPGSFGVKIWKKTKYVDPQKCTACGDCEEACPVDVINQFDESLSTRKAIYIEFPQAVPLTYTIDQDTCIGCGSCDRVCEPGAISFLEKSEVIDLEVGAIIVATGYELLEPTIRGEYGYGVYPNVITSLQYERLLSSSGPTGGKILKPSDGKAPEKIAWIQCVGSRCEEQGFPYCSRVCCMYATKEAMLTKEEDPSKEISIFYMDLRAYGKDFQQYYNHAKELGINYIRARPAKIYETPEKKLKIKYEDTEVGKLCEFEADMVVLSSAIIPAAGNKKLASVLDIQVDEYGFFKQKDVLLEPTLSSRDGIYLAGCAQGPKDIPDSVAQASGAAALALKQLKQRKRKIQKEKRSREEKVPQEPRIGVFVCHCGRNIGGYLDINRITQFAKSLPDVVWAENLMFACSEDAQKKIKEAIKEKNLNRLVVAACSPRTHAPLFQDTMEEAGLNRYLFEMANIRNQCSWVHSEEKENATSKAETLIKMACAKASLLVPLEESMIKVRPKAMIIGGGPAGMKAALTLADAGIEVTLVERSDQLGGKLRELYRLFPGDHDAYPPLKKLLNRIEENKLIDTCLSCKVKNIDGYIGNWAVSLSNGKRIKVSTIILATGFREIEPPSNFLHGSYDSSNKILTSLELERKFKDEKFRNSFSNIKDAIFINCVGSMTPERPWCCRIGCGNSIKNAKLVKELNPKANVWVLYKDMRTFGKQEEEYYRDTQSRGVVYIRYSRDPEISLDKDRVRVKVYDEIMGEEIELGGDMVVLQCQLVGDESVEELKRMLKVAADEGGFYQEAHVKLRPLDFPTDGIYVCGSAHYPKNLSDTISQAEGAASRAAIPMMLGSATGEGIVAEVNEDLCSGCRICIPVCPYSAIEFDEANKVARVNRVLCKGCGACSAACPSGAMQQLGYTDEQLSKMIKAAFI